MNWDYFGAYGGGGGVQRKYSYDKRSNQKWLGIYSTWGIAYTHPALRRDRLTSAVGTNGTTPFAGMSWSWEYDGDGANTKKEYAPAASTGQPTFSQLLSPATGYSSTLKSVGTRIGTYLY